MSAEEEEFDDNGADWGDDYFDFEDADDYCDEQESLNETETNKNENYGISLTLDDIEKEIDQRAKHLSDDINLEPAKCLLLLYKYKWDSNKLMNAYLIDSGYVLCSYGVFIPSESLNNITETDITRCYLCSDNINATNIYVLECGHSNLCTKCWIKYLADSVQTAQCIYLKCAMDSCRFIITQDVWKFYLVAKYPHFYSRYMRYYCHDFLQHSTEFSFCGRKILHQRYQKLLYGYLRELSINVYVIFPLEIVSLCIIYYAGKMKNCDAVYSYSSVYAKDMICVFCWYKYCWECSNESHWPCSCITADKWRNECLSKEDLICRILQNRNACPRCKIPMEKMQGCLHMTCRKSVGGCGHEFCWICKGTWNQHQFNGNYQCNQFVGQYTEDGDNNVKFEFYYQRYKSHLESLQNAMQQKKDVIPVKMKEFIQIHQPRKEFLLNAVNIVIKSWHILAWTYPICYYLKLGNSSHFELLTFHQGMLQNFCDGLQERLDFHLYRIRENKIVNEIMSYSKTVEKYMNNIVIYIEEEMMQLDDVI